VLLRDVPELRAGLWQPLTLDTDERLEAPLGVRLLGT
jgi:hypothetical protein